MAIDDGPIESIVAPSQEGPSAVTCRHRALTSALATVAVAVNRGSTLTPELRGVLIQGTDRKLTLTATNRETSITTEIPGQASWEGALLVDHRELTETLEALAKGRRRGETANLAVVMTTHDPHTARVEVDGQVLSVRAYDPSSFPEVPKAFPVVAEIDREDLVAAVPRIVVAAGKDEVLPQFFGVKLEITRGAVVLVGADRYRLATARIPAPEAAPPVMRTAVVSHEVLAQVVKRFTGSRVQLGWANRWTSSSLSLSCGDITVVTASLTDLFVDYAKVLPVKAARATVRIAREHAMAAVRQAMAVSDVLSELGQVVLVISGSQVSILPKLVERADEVAAPPLDATVNDVQGNLRMTLAGSYLLEALNSFASDHVVLHIDGPKKALVMTETSDIASPWEFRHILMPITKEDAAKTTPATCAPERPLSDGLRVTCDVQELANALRMTGLAVGKKSAFGHVPGVLMEAEDGAVVIKSSGRGASVIVRVPAHVEASPIKLRVDHDELSAVLAALTRGQDKRELAGLKATLAATEPLKPVLHLDGYSVPLTGYEGEVHFDVPELPAPVAEFDGADFASIVPPIIKVLDPKSPIAMCFSVRLDVGRDSVGFLGTDRWRAALGRIPATNTVTNEHTAGGVWIDGRLLKGVANVVQTSRVRVGWRREEYRTTVSLAFGTTTLVATATAESTTLETEIPTTARGTVVINRKSLLGAVQRAAALLATKSVKTRHQSLIVTISQSGIAIAPVFPKDDRARVTSTLSADVHGVSKSVEMYFPPQRMLDALRSFAASEISLHLVTETKAMLIITEMPEGLTDPRAFRHVVMPTTPPRNLA